MSPSTWKNLLLTKMADEHTLALNGHKVRFGFRDIVQVGVTIVAALGIYFSMVAKTNKNTDDITAAKEERGKMWAEIGRMNDFGTRHSHEVDAAQQQSIDLLKQQFAEQSAQIHEAVTKLDKVDVNVLWLMGKQLEKR